MEEIEVPTEHLHETIEEEVEEAVKKNERKGSMLIAISTALMAVFAAMSSLLAGHHSDEAVIEQIKASDQWAFYQPRESRMKYYRSPTVLIKKPAVQNINQTRQRSRRRRRNQKKLHTHTWNIMKFLRGQLHYSRFPSPFQRLPYSLKKTSVVCQPGRLLFRTILFCDGDILIRSGSPARKFRNAFCEKSCEKSGESHPF